MNIVGLTLLGLCFGSFVNALVWRIYAQSHAKKLRIKQDELSLMRGRSMCVHCRHTLVWYDLIPVISWLSLRGKCRYCQKSISLQYPLVEIVAAILFVASYGVWPLGFDSLGWLLFGFWLVFLVGFLALALYDLRWMILPDKLTYPLIVLAVVQVFVHTLLAQDFSVLTGSVFGLAAVGGLFYVLFQISDGKWIGGGDVKLGFMLGLLAGGFTEGLMVVFFASLIGTVVMLPLLAAGKQSLQKRIPFGPLLIIALIIVYLFGGSIFDWYNAQLLLG